MKFSDNAMSAILLCSYIGIKKDEILRPFSLSEWNRFLDKVIQMRMEPSIVLKNDLSIFKSLNYPDAFIDRIRRLVSRGGNVAFEIDDMSKRGIEIVTLFDSDYPVLLKRRLKRKTPAVLYYSGDINLSKKIGIAVVGSRNVDQEGLEFTEKLVKKASKEKLIVYSGGARGVDTISENTAIKSGSAVVSFIADSLFTKIKKPDVLQNIVQGKLLLISDVKPDVGFTAARAMNRNKYIYASSYGAFVVSSDYNKGGTWSGAIENLKNDWTKEFVWDYNEYSGNNKLIEMGAIPYEISNENIYDLVNKKEVRYDQIDIFNTKAIATVNEDTKTETFTESNNKEVCLNKDLYNVVSGFIPEQLGNGMNLTDASKTFNISKGQMNIWLKRLCEDRLIKKTDNIYYKND